MRAIVSRLNVEERPIYLFFLSSDGALGKKESKGREAHRAPSLHRLYSFSRWHHTIPSSADSTSDPSTPETRPLAHTPGCGFGSGRTAFYYIGSIIRNLKFSHIWAISSHTHSKCVTLINIFCYLCGSALGLVSSWRYRSWYDLLGIIIKQENESSVDHPVRVNLYFFQSVVLAHHSFASSSGVFYFALCLSSAGLGQMTAAAAAGCDSVLLCCGLIDT